jgi:MFS family permease
VLAVALTAQILVVLDISVVNTALPSIGSALKLRSGDLAWLVTAYLVMSGGGLCSAAASPTWCHAAASSSPA